MILHVSEDNNENENESYIIKLILEPSPSLGRSPIIFRCGGNVIPWNF